MTVPDPVRQWARSAPHAAALATGAETWSWADLDARVDAAADRLRAGPERVAVWAETSPSLVVLVLAALRAGRAVAPFSTRWTPDAVAETARRLGLDRLVTDRAAPVGVAAVPLAAGADEPLAAGGNDPLAEGETGPLAARAGGPPAGGDRPLAVGEGDGVPVADVPLDRLPLDRPWTVVHTSGSTGAPKAVVHTVGHHVWSARGVNERLGLAAGDRWLLDLPLYHVGGLGVVVRCALAGATVCVPAPETPAWERVARLRPTHASFVATQLQRLLDADADLGGLRAVLLGGSAVPADLLDRAERAGVPVCTSYGMTETTATLTATAPGDGRAARATSGRPLAYRDVRISADGEVEAGGRTVAAVLGGGRVRPLGPWLPTGDLGHLDADGRLVVTGRRDLQFVSGGENVRPEPIEAALAALDAVDQAVVVPVPDAEFGARPVAWVRTASGGPPDAAALGAALRGAVPGFMVPVAFHAWDGAPGMKPDRPALAREAERRAASGR